jgi:hypothetical protein
MVRPWMCVFWHPRPVFGFLGAFERLRWLAVCGWISGLKRQVRALLEVAGKAVFSFVAGAGCFVGILGWGLAVF